MPDFAVSTSFKGKDKGINAAWKRMSKNARLFGRTSEDAFDRASRSGKKFKSVTSSILKAGMVQRGIGLITQGVGEMARQFVNFDDAIFGASARFKDIGPRAKDFDAKMELVRKAARKAGSETEYTATQAAEAMDFLAKTGFNSKDAIGALVPMINLATASGEDFANVADWSSDLLGAFGLASENSAQNLKNLIRLNDVLVKSANSANVTIESQFETMKTAAPIAKQLGIRLEEVAAFTAILGSSGIKSTNAATALKNSFLNLTDLTPKAMQGLHDMGLSVDDLTRITKDGKKDMLPFQEILKKMAPGLRKLGTAGKAAALKRVFGLRAIAGIGTLKDAIPQIEKFIDTLDKAGGTTKSTADVMRRSLGKRLAILMSVTTDTFFKLFKAFKTEGVDGITSLTNAIKSFDMGPIITAFKIAFTIFKTVFTIIKPFLPAIILITAATKIWAIAQAALNFTMSANPVGLVVIGISLLVSAVYTFVRASGGMVNAFKVIGKVIMKAVLFPVNLLISGIKGLLFLASKIPGIGAKIKPAYEAVKGFQEGLNKPFEITEFDKRKEEAPNSAEAKARQNVNVSGTIGVQGPPGITVEKDKKSSPGIDFALLGAS